MKKVISLFCGVGGIDLPFVNRGYKVVYANDFDKNAVQTYNLNFSHKAECFDITKKKVDDIPGGDILLAGFPCQPFSVAGYRKGFNDTRGTLFFDVCRIINAKHPSIIFLENVKNLVSHDNGKTFDVILNSLKDLGYHIKYTVLNASQYGNMPQNRERIYIVAFKNIKNFKNFNFPDPIRLKTKISDVIDFDNDVDSHYYYTKKKYRHICNEFAKLDIKKGTVYQWRRQYVRENKSNVCPCLTANMGTGGHNVPLIYAKSGLRKLTPRECFNLQGFPKTFKLPKNIAESSLYKQAGNSVCVGVIDRIVENLTKAIK